MCSRPYAIRIIILRDNFVSKNIHDSENLALDKVFVAVNFPHQYMIAKESYKKLLQFSAILIIR